MNRVLQFTLYISQLKVVFRHFEISNGQQNSFTAETDLVQRRLASILKWPHYKFKSSEIHREMNQVHMPVV